jgi:hypothetical protein
MKQRQIYDRQHSDIYESAPSYYLPKIISLFCQGEGAEELVAEHFMCGLRSRRNRGRSGTCATHNVCARFHALICHNGGWKITNILCASKHTDQKSKMIGYYVRRGRRIYIIDRIEILKDRHPGVWDIVTNIKGNLHPGFREYEGQVDR